MVAGVLTADHSNVFVKFLVLPTIFILPVVELAVFVIGEPGTVIDAAIVRGLVSKAMLTTPK